MNGPIHCIKCPSDTFSLSSGIQRQPQWPNLGSVFLILPANGDYFKPVDGIQLPKKKENKRVKNDQEV